LFLRGEEGPLLNWNLPSEPVREESRPQSIGAVPLLKIGDLVGRREVVRTVIRVLTGDERAVKEFGVKAGCLITGIGGVGKSTVAGRVMERLASCGWSVAAMSGTLRLGDLAIAVGTTALTSGSDILRALAGPLCSSTLGDDVRLTLLSQVLANYPFLLVCDNFEDNITLGGRSYHDPVVAGWVQALCTSARTGRLLITSRYAVPESEAWLATIELGPLSRAQTAKLLFRHPRLRDVDPESIKLVQRVIGGHPRMVEYLDAILNRGRARLAGVEARLRRLARERNIDLTRTGIEVEEAIQKALEVGTADILLDELLTIASENAGDREVLLQTSVFSMPVPEKGIARALADRGTDASSIHEAVERLSDLSLLTRMEGNHLWVHRWTAEALHQRTPRELYQSYCRNGGEYLREHLRESRSIAEATEAVRLLLNGRAWDESAELAWSIASFLNNYGQVSDLASFCHEVAELLRERTARGRDS
jgi:hypothetical protein